MTLPSSGPMSAAMINSELGRSATAPFNIGGAAERALAEKPSGIIALSDFYGKSSYLLKTTLTIGSSESWIAWSGGRKINQGGIQRGYGLDSDGRRYGSLGNDRFLSERIAAIIDVVQPYQNRTELLNSSLRVYDGNRPNSWSEMIIGNTVTTRTGDGRNSGFWFEGPTKNIQLTVWMNQNGGESNISRLHILNGRTSGTHSFTIT